MKKKWITYGTVCMLFLSSYIILLSEPVSATAAELAAAILVNQSTLISSNYWDRDTGGDRQAVVLSSRGNLVPTEGSSFIMLSTGRADLIPATTDGLNPGSERGNWFQGGQYGNPRDEANLQLQLRVPSYMHFLYYDVQFFTVEYPDYIGTQYNDRFIITVNSPSEGVSSYVIDVNGGDFVLNARDAPLLGSGYNLFATSGNPDNVDWLTTTPNPSGADAGATALIGREHPVSPGEIITITYDLIDVGDNQFESAAFIDNLRFSGFAKTEILARKSVSDINGEFIEPGDILEYTITPTNIGNAAQNDNTGHEFEDLIPTNTEYVPGSATAGSGTIVYDPGTNNIYWDGGIAAESSVRISFQVTINSVFNGTKISNQGIVHWDSDEDGTNDANELTDDPNVNDGIDQDGDGETGDDDPTIVTVVSYEAPMILTEDFAGFEDIVGGKAQDSYEGLVWFETTEESGESNFEVAPSYHYLTAKSFKTKLRDSSDVQYWNYSLLAFNSELVSWEVWFMCGNNSEGADLYLDFRNAGGSEIAQIQFDYVYVDDAPFTSCYAVQLSYKSPSSWVQLFSDYPNGYLYNGWYKLRIEKNGDTMANYSLTRAGAVTDLHINQQLLGSSSFSDLTNVAWYSTMEPVVCPLFFWDEHTIEMLPIP